MSTLSYAISEFESNAIPVDFWVDGSFVTKKIDPSDVDILARLPGLLYNTLTLSQRSVISWFTSDETNDQMKLDGYSSLVFPAGDPMNALSLAEDTKWSTFFQNGRTGRFPKGIIVLKVHGGAR